MQLSKQNQGTILVVDDEVINLNLYKSVLQQDYNLNYAKDGEKALQLISKNRPDLILLDIMMPGLSGYEVCERLQAGSPELAQIPVIFVTALAKTEHEVKGLEYGVVDYISKPISSDILKARIRIHLELKYSRELIKQQHDLLEKERLQTSEILNCMHSDSRFNEKGLRYFSEPLDIANGDVFLSAVRPGGIQHVLIGDFTGHGTPAAVGGVLATYLFYSLTENDADAETILNELNLALYERLPDDVFMACCFVEIAFDRRSIRFWNMGMPTSYLFSGNQVTELKSTYLFMGIVQEPDYSRVGALSVGEGDKLYMFSDGVTEMPAANGEEYGDSRTFETLALIYRQALSLDELDVNLKAYSQGNSKDDVTCAEVAF